MKPTAEQAIASLKCTTCPFCGGTKSIRQSLCRADFFALPDSMRTALYKRVGGGYEQAMEKAASYLHVHEFILPQARRAS